MKIVQINSCCGIGSTGKIAVSISDLLDEQHIENRILYFHGNSDHRNAIKMGSDIYFKIQALKSRVFGNFGFNSNLNTWRIIRYLQEYKPDLVHIHNIVNS